MNWNDTRNWQGKTPKDTKENRRSTMKTKVRSFHIYLGHGVCFALLFPLPCLSNHVPANYLIPNIFLYCELQSAPFVWGTTSALMIDLVFHL